MKCTCCITLRSAVYFGASIHIFLGFMMFSMFAMQSSVYLFRYYSGQPEEPSLTLLKFLILLVDSLFLPLGCLIFRGVEKEKLNLIKWPMIIYLIVKVTEMSLKIYHTTMHSNPQKKVVWESRLYQGFDVVTSAAYFLLLFFYARKLAKIKRITKEGDYFKSPASTNTLTMNSSKLLDPADYE